MKKKQSGNNDAGSTTGFSKVPAQSDFYSTAPTEQPLHQDRVAGTDAIRVQKTGRHQAASGVRKATVDPREKQALLGILKAGITIILLLIVFFLLWKGINIYEESVWLDNQSEQQLSPVMKETVLVEDFDILNQDAREMFAERVEAWKEAARLVRSSDGLLARSNYDQAIVRCQDALKIEPAHMGALERLGLLYYNKGMVVESINAYTRLLSVDPSRTDLQVKLIQALDAYEDSPAVIYMAEWYLSENSYNDDIQRYLANAFFKLEDFEKASVAYHRVLNDSPDDHVAREKQAKCHMHLSQWELALQSLDALSESNYRDPNYYHDIAVCNAQLGHSYETVQILGKAAHLFGQQIVVGWIQDPQLDPVREDRTFQAFADRVGGEEFRKWLEKVAQSMDADERKDDVAPQLKLPDQGGLDKELLTPNR